MGTAIKLSRLVAANHRAKRLRILATDSFANRIKRSGCARSIETLEQLSVLAKVSDGLSDCPGWERVWHLVLNSDVSIGRITVPGCSIIWRREMVILFPAGERKSKRRFR